jgi:uncharacterized protein YacL (UPF0231 family)
MDYQFYRDLLGNPVAKCELETENYGDWLSNDIAQDRAQVSLLLAKIELLQQLQINHYQHIGKVYHLLFADDEVELVLNNTSVSETQTLSPELENPLDSQGCGLADFKALLKQWQIYILSC